jgi:hypothetical protein
MHGFIKERRSREPKEQYFNLLSKFYWINPGEISGNPVFSPQEYI